MSNYIYKFANQIKYNAVPPINDVLLAFRTLKAIPDGLRCCQKLLAVLLHIFKQ